MKKSNIHKGVDIAFEGVDGSGKDCQLDMLFSVLIKKNKFSHILRIKEPSDKTYDGIKLYNILKGYRNEEYKNQILDCFVNDRIELSNLKKDLKLKGTYILSSRSVLSTYAYQGTQYGLSNYEIFKIHENNGFYKKDYPDLILFYDVDIENIKDRLQKRDGDKREYFEQIHFLKKVINKYYESIEFLKSNIGVDIRIIDGNQSIEKVHEDTLMELSKININLK